MKAAVEWIRSDQQSCIQEVLQYGIDGAAQYNKRHSDHEGRNIRYTDLKAVLTFLYLDWLIEEARREGHEDLATRVSGFHDIAQLDQAWRSQKLRLSTEEDLFLFERLPRS